MRWIDVAEAHSIAWNVQPHKKGLNLGIFKHPGSVGHPSPNFGSGVPASLDHAPEVDVKHSGTKAEASNLIAVLEGHGYKCVSWEGKCEADQITVGRYDVPTGAGGTYGIVLDNTFSRAVAKDVTLAYVIHTTGNAPKFGGLRAQQRKTSSHSTAPSTATPGEPTLDRSYPVPQITVAKHNGDSNNSVDESYFTGIMYKKRRKRNQGYAKRFFSLDFTSATLSYYRDSRSSALRGAIPLSLASIGVDGRGHEFHIDSGAEVWHVRLRSKRDFEAWKKAFNKVAGSPMVDPSNIQSAGSQLGHTRQRSFNDIAVDRDWQRVEALVGRISGSRHALRRLAQDTDPKYITQPLGVSPSTSTSELNTAAKESEEHAQEKISFWRRKPSSGSQAGAPSLFRRVSGQSTHASSAPGSLQQALSSGVRTPGTGNTDEVHQRCLALLRDLDTAVQEFSSLLVEHKSRYSQGGPMAISLKRTSLDSARDEFYDAEEGDPDSSQMMHIIDSDNHVDHDLEKNYASDVESDTSSEADFQKDHASTVEKPTSTLFPQIYNLLPKTVPVIASRESISPPKQPPPSIVGFLRKNAGKDLSTVAMPVTANEPTSLLQRLAEPLEAASLLTSASASSLRGSDHVVDRLLYIAAFAIAGFASNRIKERALRKPFNPMLGETFELVRRETNGQDAAAYRFVAEKVTHHPVQMAWQADSLGGGWSMSQSPQPTQKFWGKSMELNTAGKVRVTLHNIQSTEQEGAKSERYSWTQATGFLRNIIAGEKYLEPVQSMTVLNEDTGHRAVAAFKASGMFSGRSEDVSVTIYEPESQAPLAVKLTGKWTSSLSRSDTNEVIWQAGPVVADSAKVYGFTTFAAGLNEMTEVEQDTCAPTDSRLRPDQRSLEDGQPDQAEGLKARLEERQRGRRKTLEAHGKPHEPAFFVRSEAEGASQDVDWVLKEGEQGYWQRRERRDWNELVPVFEV